MPNSTNQSLVPTNRRRLSPSVKMSGAKWRLSVRDREYLALIAAEPVEYVCDQRFTWSRAEARFGQAAPTSAAIFACFNYARFRVYRIFLKHEGGTIPLDAIRSLLVWSRRADSLLDAIVRKNSPLIIAMMKRTGNLGCSDENDMFSDANLALSNSVKGFDWNRMSDKGTPIQFSTYSCRAILKAIARAGGRATKRKQFCPLSYDSAMERDDTDDTRREEAKAHIAAEVLRIVEEKLAGLNKNEETVIQERYFSDARDGRGETLEHIGRKIGISKERVRQIDVRARQKIRDALEPSLL